MPFITVTMDTNDKTNFCVWNRWEKSNTWRNRRWGSQAEMYSKSRLDVCCLNSLSLTSVWNSRNHRPNRQMWRSQTLVLSHYSYQRHGTSSINKLPLLLQWREERSAIFMTIKWEKKIIWGVNKEIRALSRFL